ncbi:expressed unknown protein [Seminavis robusta]|uniref:LRRK2 ARM repeat domain-containing protein n=1 Tax=Seminavis robusta TaxID=568900 RepID=A0A9N8D5Y7_9STRA|nr:expressed unknown protein [Seminavis robusta]|eukprot:Sro13_g010270.1 n/a (302) ;mRNA; r:168231-169136
MAKRQNGKVDLETALKRRKLVAVNQKGLWSSAAIKKETIEGSVGIKTEPTKECRSKTSQKPSVVEQEPKEPIITNSTKRGTATTSALSERMLAKTLSNVQSNQIKIAAAAMTKLHKTCKSCPLTRKQAFKAGAPSLVLKAMSKWGNTELIQIYACATLQLIVLDDLNGAAVPFHGKDMLKAILTAMNYFPESQKVQLVSFTAMSSLFSNTSEFEARHYAEYFVKEVNGIAVCLQTMESYLKDAKVQQGALELLYAMFRVSGCRIPIRVSGAITSVAKAIDSHRQNEDIQEWGGAVMKCFFP